MRTARATAQEKGRKAAAQARVLKRKAGVASATADLRVSQAAVKERQVAVHRKEARLAEVTPPPERPARAVSRAAFNPRFPDRSGFLPHEPFDGPPLPRFGPKWPWVSP
jgi:hypothetical protein